MSLQQNGISEKSRLQRRKIIVVGGGASGLMAAGMAAESGAETIVLEKMKQPGVKLCITGKGRCNITNIEDTAGHMKHFGSNGLFLRQALAGFSPSDLIAFLHSSGVQTVIERGGRVFPESGKARDVLDALLKWIKRHGGVLYPDSNVERLIVDGDCIKGVELKKKNNPSPWKRETYMADAVIVAPGGSSYPGTGSTGDGFRLAESVGHRIIPVRPALVPLLTKGDVAKRLEGLSLRNVNMKLVIAGKKIREEFGEMVFTASGVSGPVVLTISGQVVDSVTAGEKVTLSFDLKPALDEKKLDERLINDLNSSGRKKFNNVLKGLLPAKLIPVCIDLLDLSPDKLCNQISSAERKKLLKWLKDFRLEVIGYSPFSEAIITAGGIDLKGINPRTMESRFVKGLYFAGEVLDLNADTGGYNLQAAFSSGRLAGYSAATSRRET